MRKNDSRKNEGVYLLLLLLFLLRFLNIVTELSFMLFVLESIEEAGSILAQYSNISKLLRNEGLFKLATPININM
jgi:hypothetical protein